jgi:hypothetical protein
MIPHIDVDGRVAGSPISIKANVVPLRDEITIKRIPKLLAELGNAVDADGTSLLVWYEVGRQQVLYFPGFTGQQKGLRRDREAESKLPPLSDSARILSGQLSGRTPDQVPRVAGATPAKLPDKGSQVEVEGEVQGKGEVEVVAGRTPAAAIATTDAPVVLVAAANRGIRERFGEQPSPIRHSAGSTHEAVEAIQGAGVPIAFARDAVFTCARECSLDRAPRSLKYFVGFVIDRWHASQEYATASRSDAKALVSTNGANGVHADNGSGSFVDAVKRAQRAKAPGGSHV